MANNLGKYIQDAWCAWIKGTTFPASPANLYLALFTTAAVDDSNSITNEVSGGTYARQAIASSGWSAASGDAPEQISNSAAIDWTTTLPTCTLYGWKLMSSSSGAGNCIYSGNFASPISINAGDPTSFAIGAFILQIGNP